MSESLPKVRRVRPGELLAEFLGEPPALPRTGRRHNRGRCVYLGDQTEFKPGCNGWRCEHECDHPNSTKRALHLIAIPGDTCQQCPHWSDVFQPEEIDDPSVTGESK